MVARVAINGQGRVLLFVVGIPIKTKGGKTTLEEECSTPAEMFYIYSK